MCGICGYITYRSPISEKAAILNKMCELLFHRGPDEGGVEYFENVAIGHRRLSIIDLAEGQQPMASSDGKLWIVFNGEIYNFRELRDDLKSKGITFRTNSDTEVILHGYRAYGYDVLHRLNGMFAFAIYDRERRVIFAARDRLGKKPFYYYPGSDRFIFSSELQAILADPEVPRDINPEAVDKFLSYTQIPAPLTIFKGIYKLRPGHCLVWEDHNVHVRQYWDVHYGLSENVLREEEYLEELEFLLKESVKSRLIADVPLGAFLSGGIDSSLIVAIMSHICSEPVKTFTIGFEESKYSEQDDAKLVAKSLNTDHHEQIVRPDAVEILPRIVWHTGEPFADSSALPTYYVSQFARRHVTVALSGDGGDELFAGYNHYFSRQQFDRFARIPRFLRRCVFGPLGEKLPMQAPGKFFLKKLGQLEQFDEEGLAEIYPGIKHQLLQADLMREISTVDPAVSALTYWSNKPAGSRLSALQYLDTKVYLAEDILSKVDRMSMANSLETRAPFLDYKVVEFAATIPPDLHHRDGRGKYLLRKLARRYLPDEILNKKKQGFAIPRDEWFRGELREYASALLRSKKFANRGYFNQATVELILQEHLRGSRDYSTWIWCLIVFEIWHHLFIDPDTRRI